MNAESSLVKHVVRTGYENLPAEVVQATKKSILDSLGVMLAASTIGDGVREVVALVTEAGGKEESTIVSFGHKVPSWMAAFANGAMAHALDYEDIHYEAALHPTAQIMPAAFAIAERIGRTNGREFITALALGSDIICRLGLCLTRNLMEHGWLTPTVLGVFGSALTAGKLLGLSKEQMANALGLAFFQAAGSGSVMLGTHSVIRAIRDSFTGKAGVLSALMAQRGLTGVESPLLGKFGLYGLYFRGEYNPAPLTTELGKTFEGANVGFKPWPSCTMTHPYIYGTLDIVREHGIAPEDVADVTLVVGNFTRVLFEPLEERRKPKSAIVAKASLPFVVALALGRRRVVLADFLPQGLEDPAVLQIAERIAPKYVDDPQFNLKGPSPAIVEIKTKDGRSYSKRVDCGYGHPKNPMTKDDLLAKFRDCATYSAKPLSEDKVNKAIELVNNLEEVNNVNEVIQLVS